jgi:hypothetical protein
MIQNWPTWIPAPRSWFNAIALILLMTGLQLAIAHLWVIIISLLTPLPPKAGILLSVIAQLCPIVVIAFIHNWLHRFLDIFFPESQLPEIDQG